MSKSPKRKGRRGKRSPHHGRSARWLPVLGLFAVVALIVPALIRADRTTHRRAIIVDQLSLTQPNDGFVRSAMDTLGDAGYDVDYVAGAGVTVRFIESLPARKDDIIVLRAHSARILAEGSPTDDVALFTGEMIDLSRYEVAGLPDVPATAVAEVLAMQPREIAPADDDMLSPSEQSRTIPMFYDPTQKELPWFGILPAFIERDLKGSFKDSSVIVFMGCDGMRSHSMATAFAGRGAGTFIGWDQSVSGPHTDAATERLLELIARDGVPAAEAVERTMRELGPDPLYEGRLALYTNP